MPRAAEDQQPNSMREQILATPAALAGGFAELEKTARLILTTPEIYGLRKIVICGSGDSFFAGGAVEMAFEKIAGIDTEALPAMEAGRYRATFISDAEARHTLVIAISNSGEAARTTEAAIRFARRGALVVTLTKSRESRLAQAGGRIFHLPTPAVPAGPGYGPFLFTIAALLLIAIRFADVRMRMTMDAAWTRRREVGALVERLPNLIGEVDEPCRGLARKYASAAQFEFLGSGPGAAVARYGAAKMLEAVGVHAGFQDTEEWMHLNYFVGDPGNTVTVLVSPRGAMMESRALELLPFLRKLGRPTIVVAGGAVAAAANAAGFDAVAIDDNCPEEFSPLLYAAPLALLAAYLSEIRGAEYGRGSKGRWEDSADASTVQKSLILED